MTPNPTWYVCRVISRQEKRIVASLEEKGLTVYCPMETVWAKRATRKIAQHRALSPGYVFVLLPPNDGAINPKTGKGAFGEAIDEVRSDRRVKKFMCDGAGNPQRVSTSQLRAIVILEMFHAFDETWTPPKPKKVKGQKYSHRWKRGDRVLITKGAFADWKGYVKEAKGKAFVVLLHIFGQDREVTVSHADMRDAPAQDIAEQLAA